MPAKIADHQREPQDFENLLQERIAKLKPDPATRDDFLKERHRFLPSTTMRETVSQPAWWINFFSPPSGLRPALRDFDRQAGPLMSFLKGLYTKSNSP
jgi:hypothetical protein